MHAREEDRLGDPRPALGVRGANGPCRCDVCALDPGATANGLLASTQRLPSALFRPGLPCLCGCSYCASSEGASGPARPSARQPYTGGGVRVRVQSNASDSQLLLYMALRPSVTSGMRYSRTSPMPKARHVLEAAGGALWLREPFGTGTRHSGGTG